MQLTPCGLKLIYLHGASQIIKEEITSNTVILLELESTLLLSQ